MCFDVSKEPAASILRVDKTTGHPETSAELHGVNKTAKFVVTAWESQVSQTPYRYSFI